ncbi:MAG: HU family DNA-binding protein [Candidatus Euphemobacter frigidus]|nr:HU family DNA-binding protein [Candidatus Euphemobacter frigidus]MDP8276065.1 HU family DNA-binding protein [Candidatus Euphemobacter frigidus]
MAKTKKDIIAQIAKDAGISKKAALAAYESLVTLTYKGAKAKVGITLPGLGKFIKVRRKARWGRNPATGQKIRIKAKTIVKVRVAKAAQDAIV